MALAGDLKEIAFSDVAQLYSRTRRTAMLVVSHPETQETLGVFYFDEGELVDARMGNIEGVEAVYKALELKEGTFRAVRDVKCPERRIFQPLGLLLLESLNRLHEDTRVERRPTTYTDFEPEPGVAVSTMGGVDDPLADLAPVGNAEIAGRMCLTCGKQYSRGDTCPDDGTRLVRNTGGPLSVQPPAVRPPPEVYVDARESRRRLIIGVIGGLVVVLAFVGILVVGMRANRPLGEATGRRAETTAALLPTPSPAAPATAPPAEAAPTTVTGPIRSVPGPTVQPLAAGRGITDTEIKFGMVAPFSGPAAELGRQMKIGIEAAFATANEEGGIAGRKLRLETRDDGYEPARTVPAMRDLYENEQVFGIVGNVGTPNTALALPFAMERKMLFFGAFSGSSLLRREPPERYAFNFRASNAEETAALARYLIKNKHLKPEQLAVFAQQDAFGDGGYLSVLKAIHGIRGYETATVLRVGYRRNTLDVTEAALKVLAPVPHIRAVIMVATYRAAAKFIERVKERHPSTIFANVSFVGATSLAEELNMLGPKFAAGTIVTQVVPPVEGRSSAVEAYRSALTKAFPGEKPDYVSFEGFLTAKLLIAGLARTGRDLDTEKLVATLEAQGELDVGIGAPVKLGPDEHQASHKVWATELDAQGRYQLLDLE